MTNALDDLLLEEDQRLPTDAELGNIARLVEQLQDAEAEVKTKELELKAAEERKTQLETRLLPDALMAVGLSEVKLLDGSKVTVQDVIKNSVPADPERKAQAIQWLRDNGGEELVKAEVELSFGKGQLEKANEIAKTLTDMGYTPEVGLNVNHQSLSSWTREQLPAGLAVPAELFNLFIGKKAKVTRRK